nr:MAG TPA: YopX protein [Caudoviricetes sp.]
MREILFRGKDFSGVINHSWCFGSLDTTEDDRAIIIYPDRFGNKCRIIVDPKTVGQYTGLKDKNGTKIFEGDVVKRFLLGKMYIFQIGYDNGLASFIGQAGIKFTTFDYDSAEFASAEFEVVGNIYDNPELLGGNG